jgi:cytochrome c heme-lyase
MGNITSTNTPPPTTSSTTSLGSPSTQCPVTGPALPASSGCPVPHEKRHAFMSSSAKGCPVAHSEPADSSAPHLAHHHHHPSNPHSAHHVSSSNSNALGLSLPSIDSTKSNDEDEVRLDSVYGELTPAGVIPAAGRGNSEDGKYWENPSANSLYRALKRKNKGINPEDAMAVSAIHTAVTENSWNGIREIESYVAPECNDLSLVRFQGMDGIYTMKSHLFHYALGIPRPFDRHDWYVSRCGKELKYILDYYSMENDHGEIEYTIDIRREPSLGGLFERAKFAHHKWQNGEKWF